MIVVPHLNQQALGLSRLRRAKTYSGERDWSDGQFPGFRHGPLQAGHPMIRFGNLLIPQTNIRTAVKADILLLPIHFVWPLRNTGFIFKQVRHGVAQTPQPSN
ncbi:MAG: hypothetical protein IPM06_00720 [Rhizobiales bacterium]|nr:hypothetical protein [Hyphomicrobiales bacterium]